MPAGQDVAVRHQYRENGVVTVVPIHRGSPGFEDVPELVSKPRVGADGVDRFGTRDEFDRSATIDG